MSKYICKICRKPISMDFMSGKMMEFMDMPVDSGAHAECLRLGDSWEEMGVAKDKARTQILKLLEDVALNRIDAEFRDREPYKTANYNNMGDYFDGWNDCRTQYLARIKELFL